MESVPPINRFLLHGHWILKRACVMLKSQWKTPPLAGPTLVIFVAWQKTVVTTVIYLRYHNININNHNININNTYIYIYLQLYLKFSIYSWFINHSSAGTKHGLLWIYMLLSLLQTIYRHMYIYIYVGKIYKWLISGRKNIQISTVIHTSPGL